MTTLEMAKEAFASRGSVDAWFKDALPNFEAFEKMVRAAEREACADICDAYSADKWALYKGRAPYGGMEEGRAEDYVQGQSAGAESCGDLIRLRSIKENGDGQRTAPS